MRGLNKVMLIGRLGRDPEMVYLESGTVKASFPIATNEVYKDRDGNRVEKTDWHNIVMWRGLAQVAERFLKKGSLVYVEGKLKTRSWQDQNGSKRYITEVEAVDMQMLETQRNNNNGYGNNGHNAQTVSDPMNKNAKSQNNATPVGSGGDEDLPF